MTAYYAVAWRQGDMWEINVLQVGMTQARTRDDVPEMATDLIAVMTGAEDIDLDVHYVALAK